MTKRKGKSALVKIRPFASCEAWHRAAGMQTALVGRNNPRLERKAYLFANDVRRAIGNSRQTVRPPVSGISVLAHAAFLFVDDKPAMLQVFFMRISFLNLLGVPRHLK